MKQHSLKIYFAASIRGGRDNRENVAKIMTSLGKSHTILTEHIAHDQLSSNGETHLTDQEIFLRDSKWIDECDVIVADATVPSLGVGYEIGYGLSLNKRVICLYNKNTDKLLSAMIAGNAKVSTIYYNDAQDACLQLQPLLQ